MRGRRPTPTRLKVIAGNPGKRPLNGNEPRPRGVIPRCPTTLDAEGKKAWKRITKQLHRMGVLGDCDGEALAMLCAEWSRWCQAEAALKAEGLIVECTNKKGFSYRALNPHLRVVQAATARMQSLLGEFGLTPSSRSRLSVSPPSGEREALDEFLAENN